MEKYSGVACCFCKNNVQATGVDPCDISIATKWDRPDQKRRDQLFWCHAQCFKDRMHKNLKIHFWLDILSSDLDDDDE